MASSFVYEPFIYEFISVNSFTVTHNFGRKVNIQVFINNEEVFSDITIINDNSFSVSFIEKGISSTQTGYVVVS